MNKEIQYTVYSEYNPYLFNAVPSNTKVLDVGCNIGQLGKKLINEKGCIVYGLDYSKNAINLAKKNITKAILWDLEKKEIPFKFEKFDVIIFGDVLEHLKCPEHILKEYKKLLTKNGMVVASIPNVANLEIRLKLLFGKWDYKLGGILDQTHLKFYTKKSIIELFNNNGYDIIKINSTPKYNFQNYPKLSLLKKISETLTKINPKLFALQFIIHAKPKK